MKYVYDQPECQRWRVHVPTLPEVYFSYTKYDGKDSAHKAATDYCVAQCKKLKISTTERRTSSIRYGAHPGVSLMVRVASACWVANYIQHGRQKLEYFSSTKYTYRQAYLEAVKCRRQHVPDSSKVVVPDFHLVAKAKPKLLQTNWNPDRAKNG